MGLGSVVARILEVIGALLGSVGREERADGGAYCVFRAGGGFVEHMLELGEYLLDRVQIG